MRANSDSLLDTIVALATPLGRSALAVVRLSGRDTRKILSSLAPRFPTSARARRPYLVSFRDAAGEPIDRGLATVFAAPASFTGEDVGELSVHGSPAVAQRLIAAALSAGARAARPGEFTERAFRAGKIDLVRAEAVNELIQSQTAAAARVSAGRLEGSLSARLARVREDLLSAAAGLAAAIDFSEDAGEAVNPSVPVRLAAARDALERLAASYRTGRLLASGCRVAILGRPNAGKSTLFNALSGSARAIVTEIPGTTRDALESLLDIGGVPVTLVDTAGLRESFDVIERLGVERAREEGEKADAVLYVFDASEGLSAEDAEILSSLDGKPRILVANKSDCAAAKPPVEGAVRLCGLAPDAGEKLRSLLSESIAADIRTEESSEILGSLRQKDLVERARQAAADALVALADGLSPEYAATHCHEALDALADLTGETTSEDVLARVFATFCIGK